jgi:nicotinamidase-related amidase
LNSTSKGIKKDTAKNLEIDKRIKIVSDNIFCKEKGNAFTSLELTEFIEKNKVEDFVVIGLMAEYCLYNTVCGGLNLDYKISVIPNAVFGKSEGGKTKYLDKMYKKGAKKLDFE